MNRVYSLLGMSLILATFSLSGCKKKAAPEPENKTKLKTSKPTADLPKPAKRKALTPERKRKALTPERKRKALTPESLKKAKEWVEREEKNKSWSAIRGELTSQLGKPAHIGAEGGLYWTVSVGDTCHVLQVNKGGSGDKAYVDSVDLMDYAKGKDAAFEMCRGKF